MYCHKCGKELEEDVSFCSSCGASVNGSTDAASGRATHYMPYAGKSVGTALVLGFLFPGLGHLYIGKLARGLCILVANIFLEVATILLLFVRFNDDFLTYNETANLLILSLILLIPAFILLIWNLFDVNKLGNEYNDCIRRTGAPPW